MATLGAQVTSVTPGRVELPLAMTRGSLSSTVSCTRARWLRC